MRRSHHDRTGSIERETRVKRPVTRRRGLSQTAPEVDGTKRGRVANDWSRPTFERQSALLGDERMSHPANAGLRSEVTRSIQRSFGNKYVQRLVERIAAKRNVLVQTKLTVGPAGDKYEQEADNMASQVVKSLAADKASSVQKQDDEVGQAKLQRQSEEEELQMKLQRQPEEEELQMKLQRQPEEEELQMKLQRQEEEEELQMKLQRQDEEEELQMASASDEGRIGLEGGSLDQGTEGAVEGARSGGSPLPDRLRASMEGAFGADFGGVRVHSDARSDELNNRLTSRAFTTGQDIFLKKGEYKPDSKGGKELLAHELTHVVQQKGDEVQEKKQ